MNAPAKSKGKLKVTQIGNSLGVILPKEIIAALKVAKGDELSVVETPDGIELRPYDPDFEKTMEVARRVMRERRAALRELAK